MRRSGHLYSFFVYVPVGFNLRGALDRMKRTRARAAPPKRSTDG